MFKVGMWERIWKWVVYEYLLVDLLWWEVNEMLVLWL